MTTLSEIRDLLKQSIKSTQSPARFFKTGKYDYAAHDVFIGVPVPSIRSIAKTFREKIKRTEITALLKSKINEERLLALIILAHQYQTGDTRTQENIYQFYIKNLQHVNNWNLVDSSAHLIVGAHLIKRKKRILRTFAKSNNLWERRIAIIATWYFIRNNQLDWTFKIATLLLQDKHDLIHKATGWMLREAGKKDPTALINFLNDRAEKMPRTMLRYAIEKFSPAERTAYLYCK